MELRAGHLAAGRRGAALHEADGLTNEVDQHVINNHQGARLISASGRLRCGSLISTPAMVAWVASRRRYNTGDQGASRSKRQRQAAGDHRGAEMDAPLPPGGAALKAGAAPAPRAHAYLERRGGGHGAPRPRARTPISYFATMSHEGEAPACLAQPGARRSGGHEISPDNSRRWCAIGARGGPSADHEQARSSEQETRAADRNSPAKPGGKMPPGGAGQRAARLGDGGRVPNKRDLMPPVPAGDDRGGRRASCAATVWPETRDFHCDGRTPTTRARSAARFPERGHAARPLVSQVSARAVRPSGHTGTEVPRPIFG